tara:strand:- start:42474 stop:42713 length:240 start_codon:yes stop_codon:yes gene_type:complete
MPQDFNQIALTAPEAEDLAAWGLRPSPSYTCSASVFMPRRISATPPVKPQARCFDTVAANWSEVIGRYNAAAPWLSPGG